MYIYSLKRYSYVWIVSFSYRVLSFLYTLTHIHGTCCLVACVRTQVPARWSHRTKKLNSMGTGKTQTRSPTADHGPEFWIEHADRTRGPGKGELVLYIVVYYEVLTKQDLQRRIRIERLEQFHEEEHNKQQQHCRTVYNKLKQYCNQQAATLTETLTEHWTIACVKLTLTLSYCPLPLMHNKP